MTTAAPLPRPVSLPTEQPSSKPASIGTQATAPTAASGFDGGERSEGGPARRSMSREEVLRAGQAGDPYSFIPLAIQVLRQTPQDAAVRFLLATNYAKLLLKTPAAEQLDLLAPEVQSDDGVRTLREVLGQLPPDRLSVEAMARTLKGNLLALRSRQGATPFGLRGAAFEDGLLDRGVEQWRRWATDYEFLTARTLAPGAGAGDRNILVRRKGDGSPGDWVGWFGDARSVIAEVPLGGRSSAGEPPDGRGTAGTSPLTVEGLSPPWLFKRVYDAASDPRRGQRVQIRLIQSDPMEFLSGLAMADVAHELADPHVSVYVGRDASAKLRTDLRERLHYQFLGPGYTNVGLAEPCVPSVREVHSELQAEQELRRQELVRLVDAEYAPRTFAWYQERFERALNARGEPLRVLVPTCRYSTFIRHSAQDIADAFSAAGCETRVLIEPDEHTSLASLTYLREFADFKPDLVVLINYTRANLPGISPAKVPFVCWVQDAMPHLFDENIGAAQTPWDFLAGHIHEEFGARYRYPNAGPGPGGAIQTPVLISTRKFSPEPVDASLRERLACEVAFVSHHSASPAELHEQILAGGRVEENLRTIFERLFGRMRLLVDECATAFLHNRIRESVLEVAREVLRVDQVPPVLLTRLVNNYAFPIADRMIRHDAAAWAAAICDRRGWRFRLHGKGWERQPGLAKYAAGELTHGEELRASYQAAACHIHASIHWAYHQRVMECACSGGVPIYRLKFDDLALLTDFTRYRASVSDAERLTWPDKPGAQSFAVADVPEAMMRTALLQRLGLSDPSPARLHFRVQGHPAELLRGFQQLPIDPGVVWMLGDLSEVGFRTEAEMERVIERAVERPAWREDVSRGIASRVRQHFTYDQSVQRILSSVLERMRASSEPQ